MTTYIERMGAIKDEEQKKFLKSKEQVKPIIKMSEKDLAYAQALVRLRDNDDFKIFLNLESEMIAERMTSAFKLPTSELGTDTSYGERMAFNHGRFYQMRHIIDSRNMLLKIYAEQTKKGEENNG